MSDGIAVRTGQFLHAKGMSRNITFGKGRTFTVVMSGARAAGVIAPEMNGLVVIDGNSGSVLLAGHMKESSGYFGPSERQKAEFERVASMTDWKEFTAFLRGNKLYAQGSLPDIDNAKPDVPDATDIVFEAARNKTLPGLPGKSILPAAIVKADADPNVPYDFPLRTKLDIAAHIAAHAVHGETFGPSYLAWNIKVYGVDTTGKVGSSPNEVFDGLWEAYVQKKGSEVFEHAAEDALRTYVGGEATSYPGKDQGSYEFSVGGRSGGWLELTKFDGADLGFRSLREMVETLLDMDDRSLAKLYVAVTCFDKDIDPKKNMAYHIGFVRESKEEEWSDMDFAESEAAEVGLDDWTHPNRGAAPGM